MNVRYKHEEEEELTERGEKVSIHVIKFRTFLSIYKKLKKKVNSLVMKIIKRQY